LTAQLNKKLTMAYLSIRQFDNCRIVELNATIKHKSFFKSQHFPDRLNYVDFIVLQHYPACLKNVAGYAIDEILTEANVQGSVYPGFWASIGFLVIAGVLVRLVMLGLALLSVPLEDTAVGELMPLVIGPVLGILGGIIPLFMYSSYVRLSIMQLIGG